MADSMSQNINQSNNMEIDEESKDDSTSAINKVVKNTKFLIEYFKNLSNNEQNVFKNEIIKNIINKNTNTIINNNIESEKRVNGVINLPPETKKLLETLQQNGYRIEPPKQTYAQSLKRSHGGSSSLPLLKNKNIPNKKNKTSNKNINQKTNLITLIVKKVDNKKNI